MTPGPQGVFSYSNSNYDTLELLVERAAGMSFGEFIQTRVFGPLEMNDSYVDAQKAEAGGLAPGYYHWLGFGYQPFDAPLLDGLSGSATMFVSLEDLTHVLLAHLGEGTYRQTRVVSQQGALKLRDWAPFRPGDDAGYAMGWNRFPVFGPRTAHRVATRAPTCSSTAVTGAHIAASCGWRLVKPVNVSASQAQPTWRAKAPRNMSAPLRHERTHQVELASSR